MEPIQKEQTGSAVEDVQARLVSLGYEIDEAETDQKRFGDTTEAAIVQFREDQKLPFGNEVDALTWSKLVDETYSLGDRTLYLRLPNFHGRDVATLQKALNILGFSCEHDGYFGPHTEAAVKQFQENVGMMPDGMCFPDTFNAILRMRHVWDDERRAEAPLEHPMGFARAVSVLDEIPLGLSAVDAISRNVTARIWNLASATNENSKLILMDEAEPAEKGNIKVLLTLTTVAPSRTVGISFISMDEVGKDFARRLHTAASSSRETPVKILLQLPTDKANLEGSFTSNDAQMLAGLILDGICSAFADLPL